MNNSNILKYGIGLFFIFIISGCSTFKFAPSPPTFSEQIYTPKKFKMDIGLYEPEPGKPQPGVSERTKYRNKMVYSIASEIDKNYDNFKNTFFGERAGMDTALDMAQLGLTSAATLVGGPSVHILSAIATGVTGSRLSFNKNFFKEKTPDLLLTRMDALRTEQWSQIYLKLMKDDDIYSFYEAERDLLSYYEKGTLQAAFQNIISESGAAQQNSNKEIKDRIKSKYGASISGPKATELELKEIKELYLNFLSHTLADQEKQAQSIVQSLQSNEVLKSEIPPTPDAKSDLDKFKSYYGSALEVAYPKLRAALVKLLSNHNPQGSNNVN